AAIASAVASRSMPPWMPADGCQSLSGARVLSPAQLQTVSRWAAQGAPAGDPADAPGPVAATVALPRVDAVLDPGTGYTPQPAPGAADEYRCFHIPLGLASDAFLTGYEVVPGARAIVHHVVLVTADRAEASALDAAAPGPGWPCFGGTGTA